MPPSRKYYGYSELPEILECSFNDLKDYVYRQHIIRPSLEYKGLVVNAKFPNRVPPNQIDGVYEVDMTSSMGHNTINSPELYYTSISRIYIKGILYQLVHIEKSKFISPNPKYKNPYLRDYNIKFNLEPENLLFLKSSIDKLLEKEALPALEPTLVNKEDNKADNITNIKKVIKAQGFATRADLALITGKSVSTLSNKKDDSNSGWDSNKRHYPIEAIIEYYNVDFLDLK